MSDGLKVAATRCKNCLFSPGRLVDPDRAQHIVEDCLERDKYFICHCSTYNDNNPDEVCCRGFWDEHGRDVVPTRIALAFDIYQFVELEPTDLTATDERRTF